MNKPAWFLGMTTVALAGGCLYLLLQDAGDNGVDAQTLVELEAQLSLLRAERDRLETDMRSLRSMRAGSLAPPQPMAASANSSSGPAPLGPGFFRPPEFSAKTRRSMARLRNGKMFKELGLSEAEVESLLDVLAAQDERAMSIRPGSAAPDADLRAQNRAEVEAVIGPARAAQLEAWQQQFFTRMELRRMRDQLEDVGEPLSEAQLTRLKEHVQARPPAPPPIRQKDEPGETYAAKIRAWRSENREQMRAEVSSVLEPRQLAHYDEIDDVARDLENSMPMLPTAGRAAP